jgi:hypothetical protein
VLKPSLAALLPAVLAAGAIAAAVAPGPVDSSPRRTVDDGLELPPGFDLDAPPASLDDMSASALTARSVFGSGTAGDFGDMGTTVLNGPVNDIVATASGAGYWLLGDDGGVFSFGDARFFGSMGGRPLAGKVISLAPTPTGAGYWFVARDGGMFAFGDAGFFGSMGGQPLNQPVVGMVPTRTGRGYWLVAADGGVFAFGDAGFVGSLGGTALEFPIVGLTATPDGRGYWMVDQSGRVFAFGTARVLGFRQTYPNAAVDIVSTPTGNGYWVVRQDGTVNAFGDATALQPGVVNGPGQRAVGIASTPDGRGVWVATTGNYRTVARPGNPNWAPIEAGWRWNPCAGPIEWRYNPANAPAGASVEFFQAGFDYLAEVTGLQFRYAGTTTTHPLDNAAPGIVLGWYAMPGSVVGQAYPDGRNGVFSLGGIGLDSSASIPFTWTSGWGTIFLHEAGHALGLAHVNDPQQLMYPTAGYVTTFGDGDLSGLSALGAAQGCTR